VNLEVNAQLNTFNTHGAEMYGAEEDLIFLCPSSTPNVTPKRQENVFQRVENQKFSRGGIALDPPNGGSRPPFCLPNFNHLLTALVASNAIQTIDKKQLVEEAEHDIKNYSDRGQCYLPKRS
jgi:hypothetical protein